MHNKAITHALVPMPLTGVRLHELLDSLYYSSEGLSLVQLLSDGPSDHLDSLTLHVQAIQPSLPQHVLRGHHRAREVVSWAVVKVECVGGDVRGVASRCAADFCQKDSARAKFKRRDGRTYENRKDVPLENSERYE